MMPGGKCLKQTDEEADEEYAAVQRLLPIFKKYASTGDNMPPIYLRIEDKQAKENGFPPNTWIALMGAPPIYQAYSSTHLFECARDYPEVARRLAELSGQTWYTRTH